MSEGKQRSKTPPTLQLGSQNHESRVRNRRRDSRTRTGLERAYGNLESEPKHRQLLAEAEDAEEDLFGTQFASAYGTAMAVLDESELSIVDRMRQSVGLQPTSAQGVTFLRRKKLLEQLQKVSTALVPARAAMESARTASVKSFHALEEAKRDWLALRQQQLSHGVFVDKAKLKYAEEVVTDAAVQSRIAERNYAICRQNLMILQQRQEGIMQDPDLDPVQQVTHSVGAELGKLPAPNRARERVSQDAWNSVRQNQRSADVWRSQQADDASGLGEAPPWKDAGVVDMFTSMEEQAQRAAFGDMSRLPEIIQGKDDDDDESTSPSYPPSAELAN